MPPKKEGLKKKLKTERRKGRILKIPEGKLLVSVPPKFRT